LRMYLINSPVVRGETLCFKKAGVHGIIRDMLLPWFNAYRFLVQNVHEYESANSCTFVPDINKALKSENVMDKWILASTQTLIAFARTELGNYRLYTVLPKLVQFIEQLTNWYVRLNRKRLRGNSDDQLNALNTLFEVLLTTTKTLAPFTPFFTEYMYQNLRKCLPNDSEESVHFTEYPQPNLDAANSDIETSVSVMQTIIELCRCARERRKIAHRQPLEEILVFLQNPEDEQRLETVKQYLYDELNVKNIVFSQTGVTYLPSPDFRVLGKRLGKEMKTVAAAVKNLSQEDLAQFMKLGTITVSGHELSQKEIQVHRKFVGDLEIYEPSNDAHPNVTIALNVNLTPDLIKLGVVRHVINKIQRLRKESGVLVSDDIEVYYNAPEELLELLNTEKLFIQKRLGKRFTPMSYKPKSARVIGSTTYSCDGTEAQDLFPGAEITIELVPQTCTIDAVAVMQATGKDAAFCDKLQDVICEKDQSALSKELQDQDSVQIEVDGTNVALTLGQNIFFHGSDVQEKQLK